MFLFFFSNQRNSSRAELTMNSLVLFVLSNFIISLAGSQSFIIIMTNDSSSSSAEAVPPLECLLCAETISPYHPASPLHCPCCQDAQTQSTCCCQDCLYRHIMTIFDDALTGGRRPLTCPLGCGNPLTDQNIRQVLHIQHHHRTNIHVVLWNTYGWFCYWIIVRILWGMVLQPLAPSSIPGSMESCPLHRGWWYYRHTRAERRDLLRYEQWSINTALRQTTSSRNSPNSTRDDPVQRQDDATDDRNPSSPEQQQEAATPANTSPRRRNSSRLNNRRSSRPSQTQQDEQSDNSQSSIMMVQSCPAPDCDYRWIAANPSFRRQKQAHEQKRVFLWYEPVPPESQPHALWVDAEYLHYGRGAPPLPTETTPADQRDGRRMVCAKCHYVFCGLCRQPWHALQFRHATKSCQAYGRLLPSDDVGQVAAHAVGARACPHCGLLTQRIDGCNHMTCPCGMEYCYVCGASWNPFHYRCVPDTGAECIIL